MIGSLAEGVLAVAPDGTVAVANDAANRLLGLPEGAESARLDALPTGDPRRGARRPRGPRRRRSTAARWCCPAASSWSCTSPASPTTSTPAPSSPSATSPSERRLERARRDLVANVSHELKTPIAALKGFLELLEDGVDERHRQEFLAAMSQETGRLERLVEEQLQLARLDAGALPLDREEVDLGELARVVAAPRVPLAARDGVTLAVRPADSARRGRGRSRPGGADPPDPARQRPAPHARRRARRRGRRARRARTRPWPWRDTGEGIPAEDQPFVFDRFYRGDPSREGRSAGLGLAIARGLAAAHRGAITLVLGGRPGQHLHAAPPAADAGADHRGVARSPTSPGPRPPAGPAG